MIPHCWTCIVACSTIITILIFGSGFVDNAATQNYSLTLSGGNNGLTYSIMNGFINRMVVLSIQVSIDTIHELILAIRENVLP